jgi:hypothetical protein
VLSVERLWAVSRDGGSPPRRLVVLRHDVDTDPATAGAMWYIDRELGISSSYFFRLSTFDPALMMSISQGGSHVSYHFEELATVAWRRRIRDPRQALEHIGEAQRLFARNLAHLRSTTGLPMRVVASHGDFVNRKLGIPNSRILEDEGFRRSVDIDVEVYDQRVNRLVTSRHSDTHYPRFWHPGSPNMAIQRGEPVVYVLVHPRHWRVNRVGNVAEDVSRLARGSLYAFMSRSTAPALNRARD